MEPSPLAVMRVQSHHFQNDTETQVQFASQEAGKAANLNVNMPHGEAANYPTGTVVEIYARKLAKK